MPVKIQDLDKEAVQADGSDVESPVGLIPMLSQYHAATAASLAAKDETYVIFLHMDGVLYSQYSPVKQRIEQRWRGREKERLEFGDVHASLEERYKAAIDLFNKAALVVFDNFIQDLEDTGKKVGIVISGKGWRHQGNVSKLKELFGQHAFSKFIIGKTADRLEIEPTNTYGVQDIGLYIKHWLENNQASYAVKDFVVLYARKDFAIDHPSERALMELYSDKVVLCDIRGLLLRETDTEKALKILKVTDEQCEGKILPPSDLTISSAKKTMKTK